ncbi:MAG: methane monooxygenase/ammonia monooxygenase subunit C, partial [Nitrospira sp.]
MACRCEVDRQGRIHSSIYPLIKSGRRDSIMASQERGYDISQWYDSKPAKLGWFGMLAIGVFWVVYQRTFGYSHGLDSMTPEFDSVWMG